jgi:septum formation inhibitor-activating ATPase MinD
MRGQSVEHHRSTRVLAVANGRGGIDKTNVLASSVFALAKLRKNMLAMKTDLSLEQFDIMPAFILLTSCS